MNGKHRRIAVLLYLLATPVFPCSLSLTNASTAPGGLAVVPVQLASGQERINGVQFDIEYDPAALTVAIVPGASASSVRRAPYVRDLPTGKRVIIVDRNHIAFPDGSLLNLFVRVQPGNSAGVYPIGITNVSCADEEGGSVPVDAASGEIAVDATAPPQPVLRPEGVLNSASLLPGSIAPGEIITMIGDRLSANSTRVQFDGVDGTVLYTSPAQINVAVPDQIASGSNVRLDLVLDGSTAASVSMPVVDAAPGVFTIDSSGAGQAAAMNEDATVNSDSNPAGQGSTVTAWVTGIRPDLKDAVLLVTVEDAVAAIVDATSVEGTPGLTQVRFSVPQLPNIHGRVRLVVRGAEGMSQDSVFINVQ